MTGNVTKRGNSKIEDNLSLQLLSTLRHKQYLNNPYDFFQLSRRDALKSPEKKRKKKKKKKTDGLSVSFQNPIVGNRNSCCFEKRTTKDLKAYNNFKARKSRGDIILSHTGNCGYNIYIYIYKYTLVEVRACKYHSLDSVAICFEPKDI